MVGLPVVNYSLGGVVDPRGGLDMIWLVGVLMAGFGVGALVFYGFGGKSKRVHQLDNYAGGHFLTAQVRYQYSDNFYAGLMHLIGPWYRGAFLWLEGAVAPWWTCSPTPCTGSTAPSNPWSSCSQPRLRCWFGPVSDPRCL